jgi:archaellum component FlaC
MTREQVAEKDKLIEKLYGDVKELHIKVERLTNERNEVMEKYQESEKIWRGK